MANHILIFGSSGMVGNYVYRYLSRQYTVKVSNREDFDIMKAGLDFYTLEKYLQSRGLKQDDVVINCSAVIPNSASATSQNYIFVNTIFPLMVSAICSQLQCRFIHLSTDGVFHGNGIYTEESETGNDSGDGYGLSKRLGDLCVEHPTTTVIRGSFVGRDFSKKKSLLEWLLSKTPGETINGYTNVMWNGITCLELAKIIAKIVEGNCYGRSGSGIRHVFSSKKISKYDLLVQINKIYDLNLTVIPTTSDKPMDRTLHSKHDFVGGGGDLTIQLEEQRNFDQQGQRYHVLEYCRVCRLSGCVQPVINLGDKMPLAGAFLRNLSTNTLKDEYFFPLSLGLCTNCFLVQCMEVIDGDVFFTQGYFYHSSMIPFLVSHFTEQSKKLAKQYKPSKNEVLVVEIGCNDGVFLRPLAAEGFKVIGIDPSDCVDELQKDGYEIYNTFLSRDVAENIITKHGKCDLFLSSNSFAHINDMKTVIECMKTVLKQGGMAIIEVHYLLAIIEELNFDFIYHEHVSYYSISAILRLCEIYDLYLQDVEIINVHSKSLRLHIKNIPYEIPSRGVCEMIANEVHLTKLETYHNYVDKINLWKSEFMKLIEDLQSQGKVLYGYGASGRATTLCCVCGLKLDIVIDDAKSKIGSYTPLHHARVVSRYILKTNPPDFVIILAWPYAKNIIEKNKDYVDAGGKFIVPLPTIRIVDKNTKLKK